MIKDGDSNTAFYHASLRDRRINNTVHSIVNMGGVRVDKAGDITEAFLEYYKKLLGSKMQQRKRVKMGVIAEGPVVSAEQSQRLLAEYSSEDIKRAVFDIPGIKSPGPDGYGSFFYQENWDLIGAEVCEAIKSFLQTRNLLKEINTTVITLIPKVQCPNMVSDFRPISCCNVLYKIATKLICTRLKIYFLNWFLLTKEDLLKGGI